MYILYIYIWPSDWPKVINSFFLYVLKNMQFFQWMLTFVLKTALIYLNLLQDPYKAMQKRKLCAA